MMRPRMLFPTAEVYNAMLEVCARTNDIERGNSAQAYLNLHPRLQRV